jgi:membrane-bound lytic murein transglycosylase A
MARHDSKLLKNNRSLTILHVYAVEYIMKTMRVTFVALTPLVALVLVACGTGPQQSIDIPGESNSSQPKPVSSTSSGIVSPSASVSAADSNIAGQAANFSTQAASYSVSGYDSVPGWANDNLVESWGAFLESCKVLASRVVVWRDLCARARTIDPSNQASIRVFYEREFVPYQIRDDDSRPDGVVTGYFEPEINGSKRYGLPFIYPVYAQPDDMLYLDARRISATQRTGVVVARVEGKNAVVQTNLTTRDLGAPGLYTVNLASLSFDTLDRKVRLRANGRQLLPYFTRQEIETQGAPNARVLAFVDNPMALYEMQVQGSGRIRIRENGEVMRVAYAEQNGHPFRPTLVASSSKRPAVRTRGLNIELNADDDDADDGDDGTTRTRGFKLAKPARPGVVVVPGQRINAASAVPGFSAARVSGTGIQDPSYVFFRESNVASGGPVGALGVPLSAGRSIAVDPRTTPLGFPVFVSTKNPTNGQPMRRLTIAQDTGGAIRGAVRADYFFGDGPQAAVQARRMKERGQLWILLPKGLRVAASVPSAVRTRGAATLVAANCLVPMEDICVEDL